MTARRRPTDTELRGLVEAFLGPSITQTADDIFGTGETTTERPLPSSPRKGDWWIHRRSGRRVHVRRVGKDHVTFVAVRAAGAIRVQYRTAIGYFVRTYRPSV